MEGKAPSLHPSPSEGEEGAATIAGAVGGVGVTLGVLVLGGVACVRRRTQANSEWMPLKFNS